MLSVKPEEHPQDVNMPITRHSPARPQSRRTAHSPSGCASRARLRAVRESCTMARSPPATFALWRAVWTAASASLCVGAPGSRNAPPMVTVACTRLEPAVCNWLRTPCTGRRPGCGGGGASCRGVPGRTRRPRSGPVPRAVLGAARVRRRCSGSLPPRRADRVAGSPPGIRPHRCKEALVAHRLVVCSRARPRSASGSTGRLDRRGRHARALPDRVTLGRARRHADAL